MAADKHRVQITPATHDDTEFVIDLMDTALSPYYGGDHVAHARRILGTHLSGGKDQIGHFSSEQKMFIARVDGQRAGMIHLVGKRQGTYKISPLIVSPDFRGTHGLGRALLSFAESYAREQAARQIYCTVAEQNTGALQFFRRNEYIVAGRSDSHYKTGVSEVMLYKLFTDPEYEEHFDRPHISVQPVEPCHEDQVRKLLFERLPSSFYGITEAWMSALFAGYTRRDTGDINLKFKLLFAALDRRDTVLGVAGATPKKGEPIKVMPFVATDLPSFVALLSDVPYELRRYGHKLYMHIIPTVDETIALQQRGWRLDAAMPAAYHESRVTQQWSLDLGGAEFMRVIRVKQTFLDMIRAGKKNLEVRVGYSSIRTIQRGERLRMAARADQVIVRVDDVRSYASFQEMLDAEDPLRVAPHLGSREAVLALLKEIYPPNRERLGVIVLQVSVDNASSGRQVGT